MKYLIIAAAIVAAGAVAGCASTKDAAETVPVEYTVIREDVTIPFTSSVRNFRVGADKTLLLEGSGNRWYRAKLPEPCRSDLRWEQAIGLADRTASSVSKFTDVIVDGRRCQIIALDEIADPKEAERLAAEKAAAQEAAQKAAS
jgi:hypothetical protein